MKRKFTNVFLLVAVGIAALTSFVSCKDYEDDLRTESEIQNDLLKADLESQLKALQDKLDAAKAELTARLDAINSCDCDPEALRQAILDYVAANYQAKGAYLTGDDIADFLTEQEIRDLIDQILKDNATWTGLQEQLTNTVNSIINQQSIINTIWEELSDNYFEEYFEENINNYITNVVDFDTLAYYVMKSELANYVTKDELNNYTTNAQLEEKLKEYYTKDEIDNLITGINESLKKYVTKEELADSVLKINNAVNALCDSVAAVKQTAEDALAQAKAAAAAAAAAQDTASAANALAKLLQSQVQTLEGTVQGLTQTVNTLSTNLLNLQSRVVEVADTARTAYMNAENALKAVDTLRYEYETTLAELRKRDIELSDTIKLHFDSINNRCNILHDSIEMVRDEAYNLFLESQNAIKQVEDRLNYRIDSLAIDTRERLGNVEGRIDNLAERVQKVEEGLATAKNAIKLNELKIDTLKNRVQEAEDAIEGLSERLDSIEDRVGALEDKFKELKGRVDELFGRVDDLSDRLNKLITGIIIQGTHNPIYGTFATPWGLESFMLATYYGQHPRTDEFPTAERDYYDFPSDWNLGIVQKDETYLDEQDIAVFTEANGDNLFSTGNDDAYMFIEGEGNAGTVYLTVNSAKQQDFSGTQFQLVNTKDEEGPVKLSPIQKETDWVKYFGYTTRGVEDNGLYRAKATITEDFAKAAPKINLNVNDVKDMLANIKSNISTPTKIDMSKVLSNVYKAATSNVLPAYGIKAPWNDSEGEHAVYSSYNMAATAVHPLSFSFLKDISPEVMPGLDRLENAIGDFIDGININIPKFNIKNLTAPVIEKITLAELTDKQLAKFNLEMSFDTTITVSIDTTFWLRVDTTVVPVLDPITVQPVVKPITITIDGQTVQVPTFELGIDLPELDINESYVWIDGKPYAFKPDVQLDDSIKVAVIVPSVETAEIVKTVYPEIEAIIINPEVNPIHLDMSRPFTFTMDKGVKIWVTESVDMRDAVIELYNQMQQPIANVNDLIGQINDFLANVNVALDELNKVNDLGQQIVDMKENIKDTIYYYIEKVSDKILPYLTPGRYLQPIMFARGTNDFMRLSSSKRHPSQVRGTKMNLVPTTINAEFLSPAYRKWVAVTDVYKANYRGVHAKGGDTECINVRKTANSSSANVNKVLIGNTYSVPVTLKPGYVYEISYQAMDYSGIVRARKYYVKAQ